MCELSPVTFHGDTIFCLDYQGQPFTPMKPIVENLGLGWASQSQKLNSNRGRWGVTIIVIPSESGEQQMLCLPVRKLPSYLNSINPKKVRPELRAKIELYQAESDDALWNYWMNGRAERPTPATALDAAISPAERAELKALVDAKLSAAPAAVQGKARAEIWTRFNRHFRIAEYAQLSTVKMSEARDYLIQMEVKALGAAAQPTATAAIPALVSDDAEGHLAAIRQHVRHIYDHEAALYGIVRHNLPSLWDIQGRERRIALRALDSMERASGALESILVCLESSTRTALAAGRA